MDEKKVLALKSLAVNVEETIDRLNLANDPDKGAKQQRAGYYFSQRIKADREQGYLISDPPSNKEIEIIGIHS